MTRSRRRQSRKTRPIVFWLTGAIALLASTVVLGMPIESARYITEYGASGLSVQAISRYCEATQNCQGFVQDGEWHLKPNIPSYQVHLTMLSLWFGALLVFAVFGRLCWRYRAALA